LHEESNEGWVWIPKGIDCIETRDFIIIKRRGCKSLIRCQARIIDENFSNFYKKRLEEYNKDRKSKSVDLWYEIKENNQLPIVMNDYYRKLLHLKTQEECVLEISKADYCYQKILAFLHHPNDVVKIATYMALISITLSTLSFLPVVISYFFSDIRNFSYFLIIVAILMLISVFWHLFIRCRKSPECDTINYHP
jgi:hypothetical protein